MKSVEIGSTVYSNGNSNFSLESAKVLGVDVVIDLDHVYTWVKIAEEDGERRSITAEVFFRNYTDVVPFFKIGVTYRNVNNSSDVRFEVAELLKSDKPSSGKGLYAVARRHSYGEYSYIILDENSFNFMVQA